jgi:chloramphenicol O-acetyltransferase type B
MVKIFNIIKRLRRIFLLIMKYVYTMIVKIECESFKEPLHVNFKSNVSRTTILGKNINFNGMEISGGGKVIIGDNFHSGRNCLMITQNHNYDAGNAVPYDGTYLMKDIVIKENVWLGDRVIILGGITIEEGAIIQAGSVVVSNIPKYAIAGGHPAKVFKYRDQEHYEKLKSAQRFH